MGHEGKGHLHSNIAQATALPAVNLLFLSSLLFQASNISDALVRPHAAEAAAHCAAEAGECYDEDGNPDPVPQRVPSLPVPPVHPVQVRQHANESSSAWVAAAC